ncbi:MAG TPA: hypothetical protein VN651_15610, partial [Gemmatimonadaceae bacterium]|nr:hypothetical protein [Gemmatimonadaceae bacterium]
MRRPPLVVILAAGLALPGTVVSQTQQGTRNNAAAPAAKPAAASADQKRGMTVADYAKWRTIRDVALSDDGTWASFGYQQRKVDDTLRVKNLSTGAEQTIPRASRSQFSDDSKWVAYFVAEPIRANENGGAAPEEAVGGGRGGAAAGPARLELRNLGTGATVSWDNVASFSFSKGSLALMVRKARVGAAPDAAAGRGGRGGGGGAGRGGRGGGAPVVAGTDLILHHLADGADELIGSVSAAEFNKPGSAMAYVVSSSDREGNGLFVESIGSWQRRALDNARADYARLTWDDSGSAVAALRGMDRRGFTEKENALVAVTGATGTSPVVMDLDRKSLAGLPDSMVISEKGTLSWSPDRTKIFVGLKPQEARPPQRRDSTADVEPIGNVDVWHWKDPYIQSVQMVRAQQDRNRTFEASVLVAQKKVVPLADDRMDRVQIT